MPGTNSPAFKTGSWGSPKLDLGGCVFYAPLWRPDMVARGGAIVSGTGTMAQTPFTLAVGDNTITATGAGTFLISVPQEGTCTSGTATITGSPVTLPAGVTTSVTTGATTGTFTVATSNIIRSKDSTGHLGTIVGASWGAQGRTFDGSDDRIRTPDHASLDLVAWTIIVWFKKVADGAAQTLLAKDTTGSGFNNPYQIRWVGTGAEQEKPQCGVGDGVTQTNVQSVNALSDNTWYCLGFTFAQPTANLYLNGLLDNTATIDLAPLVNSSPVDIGRWHIWEAMTGTVGEVLIYNRVLTLSEIKRYYQATKWRYN